MVISMKKILALILAIVLALTFAACGGNTAQTATTEAVATTAAATAAAAETTTAAATTAAAETTTEAAATEAATTEAATTTTAAAATEAAATEAQTAAPSGEKITFFEFRTDPEQPLNERYARYYNHIKEEWAAMHPDVELELTGSAVGGTDSLGLLQTMLASGTAADVFVHQTRVAAWAQAGYLMDLSDQPWASRLVDGVLPDCVYDGKVYAAPAGCNGWGFYYMKDIFENELGLSLPSTYGEFLDDCQIMKDAGYDPIIVGGATGWPLHGYFLCFTSFLYGKNPNYGVDLYQGNATLAGPEMKSVFDAIQEIYDRGFISEATMGLELSQAADYMAAGKAIMGPGCPGVLTFMEDESRGDERVDLGFFHLPDENGYNCLPVIGEVVFSVNSKYDKGSTLGADLISCLVSDDSLHIMCDDTTPVGFSGLAMNYKTTGGQAYQDAFDKGPVVLQMTSWMPASIFAEQQAMVSSIFSGGGFTQAMLDNMQATYEADRGIVNILLP